MKIPSHLDAQAFLAFVDSCHGVVELVSPEGDQINLKSRLSQYISIAAIFSSSYVRELELVIHDPDEAARFVKAFGQQAACSPSPAEASKPQSTEE